MTTKKTGVGLGLSIVSKIVDGHHGSIHVENVPEGGAVFTLFFPLDENVRVASDVASGTAETAVQRLTTTDERANDQRLTTNDQRRPMPTILIIEDEAKMRRLLELNLGDDGFKTLSAGDAETGLKLLASSPFTWC